MIDPNYLTWEEVREQAEEFRTKCDRNMMDVPIAILEYVEFDLRIDIIPVVNLERDFNINGFLSRNSKIIYR